MRITKFFRLNLVIALLAGFSAWAQTANFPFPQNRVYPYGLRPQSPSPNYGDADNAYLDWKARFVTKNGAGSYRRVLLTVTDGCDSCSVSEGIGYGMLLAVNYADKSLFDDLWGYYNATIRINNTDYPHLDSFGLMHWKIDKIGRPQEPYGAATDADQDVAFALVVADRQWGGTPAWRTTNTYLQDAKNLITKIYQYEVKPSTLGAPQAYVLQGGDYWSDTADDVTNPSYFAPAYYRVFKEVTSNAGWDQVINKCYTILLAAAEPTTGLVPDWCKADGTKAAGRSYDYTYDACRTPWRIAMDYLWFGDSRAYNFCQKITKFVDSKGTNGNGTYQVVDGYKRNGDLLPLAPGQTRRNHNNAFVGPFAVGSMATSLYQAYCSESYLDNKNIAPGNYFNASLKALTLFLQTGNFNYTTPVAAPSNLKATVFSNSQINLSWTDNSNNETGFKIERKTGSTGTYLEIAKTSANVKSYSNTGLAASTTYYYRVRGYDDRSRSGYSNEVSATIVPPAAPSNLTATTFSSSQINLSWADKSSNETGFEIERKIGSSGTYARLTTVGANTTTYSNSSLTSGTSYFYRVRATNNGAYSTYSNESNATASLNLALNRPTNASSIYSTYATAKAVDGNTTTSWSSKPITTSGKTQWLQVDLQSAKTIGRIVINWNTTYYARNYQVWVSKNDTTNWTTVKNDPAGNGGTDTIPLNPPSSWRYVRIYMTLNNPSVNYYSVLELEAYASASPLPKAGEETNETLVPESFALEQNYPNPFNPTTTIAYAIAKTGPVSLRVFDVMGREVLELVNDVNHPAGAFRVQVDATHLPTGLYVYRLSTPQGMAAKKMSVVK